MPTETSRKYVTIFGIRLDSTSVSSLLTYVKYRIEKGRKVSIVTPNPEIILASTSDHTLAMALKKADIALPDGVGLAYTSLFLSGKPLQILPGRKVFLDLVKLANKNSWRVYLLGGERGVSEKVAQKLSEKYKKVRFDFADGPRLGKEGKPDTKVDTLIQKTCLEKINKFNPHLLFVALGPTKQEKWIANNLKNLNVGCVMAVGGTFNYIAGVSLLPPKWMEEAGLEWFWRLITEPWRLGRIINASIIFPLKVFWYKFSKND